MALGALDWRANQRGESPAGRQNAPHFAQYRGPVWKEHECHLTRDHVERAGGEGQLCGVTLAPLQFRPQASGNRKHFVIEDETGDAALRVDTFRRVPRQEARAVGDIEYAVARPDSGDVR
jgi:hypothetical protein